MGYNVTIIRTVAGRRQDIPPQDLAAALSTVSGWKYERNTGTLEREAGEEKGFWLDVTSRELEAKEPTEPQIALMIELANALSARVRGDDLETYRTPTETYVHVDDERLRRSAVLPGKQNPTRSQRVANYIKIGALVLLALNFLAYALHSWLSGAA